MADEASSPAATARIATSTVARRGHPRVLTRPPLVLGSGASRCAPGVPPGPGEANIRAASRGCQHCQTTVSPGRTRASRGGTRRPVDPRPARSSPRARTHTMEVRHEVPDADLRLRERAGGHGRSGHGRHARGLHVLRPVDRRERSEARRRGAAADVHRHHRAGARRQDPDHRRALRRDPRAAGRVLPGAGGRPGRGHRDRRPHPRGARTARSRCVRSGRSEAERRRPSRPALPRGVGAGPGHA